MIGEKKSGKSCFSVKNENKSGSKHIIFYDVAAWPSIGSRRANPRRPSITRARV